MNARVVAWHLLRETRILTRRAVLRAVRDADLQPRDRSLLVHILGAELRRRTALRAIAEHYAERRLRPDVALFAHIGLAQLLFLDDVPDHAAISETVESARTALGERPSAAVNALLRRVQREVRRGASGDVRRDVPVADIHFEQAVFADPVAHWLLWAEQALSLPVPIGRRWRNRLGAETAEGLARSMIEPPDVSLLVLRGEVGLVAQELADSSPRPSAHPRMLLFPAASLRTVRASDALRRGDAVLLGEALVRAAELVGAAPGERVIELRARMRSPNPALAQSGADVVLHGLESAPTTGFDAAFLAAPSSDTGILGARPQARWRFDAARSAALATAQVSLLTRAAAAVRSGGRLVYATRSIEPDENQRRIRAFLATEPEWSLAAEIESLPAVRGASGPVDGGYAARLERR
ncbi:MAG: hypothetical protein NTY35_06510 [Planctomycetota bacterium]|nr:hypothetical protein [Planctomycetota bacterium]